MNPALERSMHVLVVDDQPHVRTGIRMMLNELGVDQVSEAGGGRAALAALSQPGSHFDLILCDLRMPDRDGIEAIRSFAALGIKGAVALMSVEDERVLEVASGLASLQGLRMLGTIRKPVTTVSLAPVLARVFVQAPRHSPGAVAPEGDLEHAFLRREIQLHYQPQVAPRTGAVVGVEALVRWRHPTLGVFQPAAFMPALERSDEYMRLLTEFSLDEGVACAARLRRRGMPLRVAVNVPARAFEALDFPEQLETLVRAVDVPPGDLTIEVTETEVARTPARFVDVAIRLHLKGFRLAVDDFGMGQSGLAQLQKVPFAELKIDREFVAGCANSTLKRSVVDASLALARALRMESVAEGVHARDDLDTVVALGCEIVQGFIHARPMDEETLVAWLADRAGGAPVA